MAAENGFTPVVDLLAEKFKASVMDRTKDGSTLVHIASLHGHPDTVMAFLRKGGSRETRNYCDCFKVLW